MSRPNGASATRFGASTGGVSTSLWAATATPCPSFPALGGEVRTKVAVIGGGYTGLSAALHLARDGVDVVLLEAADPGWGASGRNGGQVIPSLKFDPDEVEELFGPDFGPRVVKRVGAAADLVFSLIDEHRIACDATRTGWIQAAATEKSLAVTARRAAQWQRRGASVATLDRQAISALIGTQAYAGGWIDRRAGSVQPLSYARGLARAAADAGVRIFTYSPVTMARREGTTWTLNAATGVVKADTVLVATNGYSDGLWPGLARSVVPLYSLQVATAPLPEDIGRTILPEGQTAADTRRLVWYFRRDREGRLIMGSRGPFTEAPAVRDGRHLRAAAHRLFPQIKGVPFEYHWSGRVAMTADHVPHLNRLAPGVYAGLGYNGRGVAMATLMGRLLAEIGSGAAVEDIDFPVTAPTGVPFHGLHRPLVRTLIAYYRLIDAVGIGT